MTEHMLHLGDCLDVLRTMPDCSVDAVVTDPPYGLSFMGKKWDYDVPSVEIWAECLRVLKPGGHLLAFAGTRTQHRMAVRIEDAGFEIRDMIAWVYGSGFPKSLDVSTALDRAAGAEGGHGPMKRGGERLARLENGKRDGEGRWGDESGRDPYTYAPATPEAQQWAGWGTALKPALEPITMARKPLTGTVAANGRQAGQPNRDVLLHVRGNGETAQAALRFNHRVFEGVHVHAALFQRLHDVGGGKDLLLEQFLFGHFHHAFAFTAIFGKGAVLVPHELAVVTTGNLVQNQTFGFFIGLAAVAQVVHGIERFTAVPVSFRGIVARIVGGRFSGQGRLQIGYFLLQGRYGRLNCLIQDLLQFFRVHVNFLIGKN
jgi:site-specific DNA-methyltransferase (adenine-specific)